MRRSGYAVHKRGPDEELSLAGLVAQEGINLVLDVGANRGQFVGKLRVAGYAGRVLSFEPLADAHAALCAAAAADPTWTIAERTAVGRETGSIDIHVAGNSQSSSALPMLASHAEAAPESVYVGSENVPVRRLDDLYRPDPADRVLLKIDVQGYEHHVLDGAQEILSSCRGLIVEMSLLPLYEGEILAREMWDRIAALGFDVWGLEPGFRNPVSGRMLQLDGYFVRSAGGAQESS